VRELAGAQVSAYYQLDEQRGHAAVRTREALGVDTYDDAVDTGRALTPDEAIAYALGTATA
jgi:hypothetical protein